MTFKRGETMFKPEEELQAILDLLGEWRGKTGTRSIQMHILPYGYGTAYDWNGCESHYEVKGEYGPCKNEFDRDGSDVSEGF